MHFLGLSREIRDRWSPKLECSKACYKYGNNIQKIPELLLSCQSVHICSAERICIWIHTRASWDHQQKSQNNPVFAVTKQHNIYIYARDLMCTVLPPGGHGWNQLWRINSPLEYFVWQLLLVTCHHYCAVHVVLTAQYMLNFIILRDHVLVSKIHWQMA